MDLTILALVATGGISAAVLLSWVRARRRRALTQPALSAAAAQIGGRLSAGSAEPELRAELGGRTVTLRLQAAQKRAVATTALPDLANTVRFYFGWDAPEVPAGLEHIKPVEAPNATLVAGKTVMRADDPALSSRFLEATSVELTGLWQAAGAKGLEVLSRGGYLTLTVHGPTFSEEALVETMGSAARLAGILDELVKSPNLLPPNAKVSCAICTDFRQDGEEWVRCAQCQGAQHLACFRKLGSCGACGHGETRPFEAPA